MSGETALILLITLPFAGSVAAMRLPTNARNAAATLAGAIALAALNVAASCYGEVASGRVLRLAVAWLPAGGVDFALRMDGYAWMRVRCDRSRDLQRWCAPTREVHWNQHPSIGIVG
jgi:multicomponent K+:H+ antiporter subunit A